MKRLFRLTIKLAVLAAIGYGIAMAIKKLTATPESSEAPLEPWPPLDPESLTNAANGVASAASTAAEKVSDAASAAADKVSDTASKAAGKVGDAADSVKDSVKD